MADKKDSDRPSVKRMVRVTGVVAKDIVAAKGKSTQQDNTELFAPPTFYIDPIELFESRDALTAGPPGPQGDAGNTGATGAQGERGLQGNTGAQGEQGVQGNTGAAGRDGYDGVTGADGPQGVRGSTGDVGPQGEQGVQGDTGPQGLQGNTIVGQKGDTGDQGLQGAQGEVGPTGSTGNRGTKTYYQASDPTSDEYADVQFEDFSVNTLTGDFFANGAASSAQTQGSGSSGGSGTASPIIDSVGILALNGATDAGYYDFEVPGDPNGSTFRFGMPFDGWVLGFTIYGSISPSQSPGFYVSKKDSSGNYTDVIHVDSFDVPNTDFSQPYTYYAPSPPAFKANEALAMKLNNQQYATYDLSAFVHVQYDPTSVYAKAQIQSPSASSSPTTPTQPSTTESDVALLDLGHFYCKNGELPTSQSTSKQFQDTYIDANDQTVLAINNSRFAPFDCYITSAAICQQNSISTALHVFVQTAAGNFTLDIGSGQAHEEQTFGATQYYVPQGGYLFANAYGDSATFGSQNPVSLSCLLTLTPA